MNLGDGGHLLLQVGLQRERFAATVTTVRLRHTDAHVGFRDQVCPQEALLRIR